MKLMQDNFHKTEVVYFRLHQNMSKFNYTLL